ncbi:hypothetical protein GQ44DRAFT_731368 [Phaeosphaeriaceae sp. PMI808]|nr:hypothetical protein GQ44DRAFT_731368 [Phaeosphaeriaceae sp. PMI808]
MDYFATQLNNNQQTTHSLRATQYRSRRKRRRDEENDDSSSPGSPDPETRAPSHALLEAAQLRVAGLSSQDESDIPSSPFPHVPFEAIKEHYGPCGIQREIAKPPTRLYLLHASSSDKQNEVTALRTTHLNVLSTLMHRCLLEQDYERAGRAWGMLLRTQVAGGHPVDPRNHARWGIGAEILLRRKSVVASNNNTDVSQPHRQTTNRDAFSEQGFELAKEYYERLIIQHPNRRLTPNAVDERTFYPAMFSLWIFETCEKSRRTRREGKSTSPPLWSRNKSYDSVLGDDQDSLHSHEEAIQIEELASAKEIAKRIDQLIASPPFDKQASLLQLRGHVGLWISALLAGIGADDEDWDMGSTNRSDGGVTLSPVEQLTRLTNYQRELQLARQFFQKAETNGASRQTATLASIDIKLKQLAKQLARMRVHPS